MGITVQDFFRPLHFRESLSEDDYKKVVPLVDFAKSFSQLTYQSVYLVDYYRRGFTYVSGNPIFLCGNKPEQVQRHGYLFYLKNVPEKDLEMLLKINAAGFSFFKTLAYEEKLAYSISYDFHLKQPGGNLMLVNHKLKPILLDRWQNPWIGLCLVSISSRPNPGNIYFKRSHPKKIYELDIIKNEWRETDSLKLHGREKEVLRYSAQGLTMEQIAKTLFISLDTVKFHKKNIFSKLKVKNISEALAASLDLGLI